MHGLRTYSRRAATLHAPGSDAGRSGGPAWGSQRSDRHRASVKWHGKAWVRYLPLVHDNRWEEFEKAGAYRMNIRTDTGRLRVGGFAGGCTGSRSWARRAP